MIDRIASWMWKPNPPDRLVPMRQRYFHSIATVVLFYLLSWVPVTDDRVDSQATTSFQVSGSLMAIGTQPFVVARIFHSEPVVGFLLAAAQSLYRWWGHPWHVLLFCAVSWCTLQVIYWLKYNGRPSLTAGLVALDTASRLYTLNWRIAPAIITATAMLICYDFTLPVPISHKRVKHRPISASISIMYNGVVALVLFYTALEFIEFFVSVPRVWLELPGAVICVWCLNPMWHKRNKRTGWDLMKGWKQKGYSLKGWRSMQRQGQFVERTIQQCLYHSSIVIIIGSVFDILLAYPVRLTPLMMTLELVRSSLM